MCDARIADVAIHGQSVLGRQVLRPIHGLHGLIKFLRRRDRRVQDRTKNANGGPQPQVGLVEKRFVSREANAATARLNFLCTQIAELSS